jgi:hypothetical protein
MNDTAQEPAVTTTQAPPGATGRRLERPADHTIYKPNGRGRGGVVRFGLNLAKGAVFVEAAPQSGERQFDWENKITMKWGLSDLGSALAVLQGRMPKAKLFHQTATANSAFELAVREDPERAPLGMTVSRQEVVGKALRKVSIPLTHGEAAVLETVLRTAVARLVGW